MFRGWGWALYFTTKMCRTNIFRTLPCPVSTEYYPVLTVPSLARSTDSNELGQYQEMQERKYFLTVQFLVHTIYFLSNKIFKTKSDERKRMAIDKYGFNRKLGHYYQRTKPNPARPAASLFPPERSILQEVPTIHSMFNLKE